MNAKQHLDKSNATTEWLDACRSKKSRRVYQEFWDIWIDYCQQKGLPENGDEILADMKRRRQSNDNTVKFFYDNEAVKFFKWLQTEYKGKKTGKPLTECSALNYVNAPRSFFAYHRYSLEIRKDQLPTSEKVKTTLEDHSFDIYQLRAMFQQGDLTERTILSCGKDLMLRVGDFARIPRDLIETLIKREDEKAEAEKRQPDIIEFELITSKEGEPASCHLSKESIELLREYLKTTPKTEFLFNLTEDALNDVLKRLAEKSRITLTGRVRWHCLRKFGITLMHGKIQESVMKYMVGKHISKDLRTYIQANNETYKGFKLIEPLISLTKSNGATSSLAKELEQLKQSQMKTAILMKLLEKLTPKAELEKAIRDVAKELGVKDFGIASESGEVTLDMQIEALAKVYEKKDLERILAENGNNH